MMVRHTRGSYEIHFLSLADALRQVAVDSVIVTDTNVHALYGTHFSDFRYTVIPAGEKSKSLEEYGLLLAWLTKIGATRNTALIALGGGVVGDLAGFAAATYMRGISLIQIPTTVVSQVDSSVGGKVGLDLEAGKNLVGAFYAPTAVYVPLDTLITLPEREFNSGMAEVWKYGFISDASLVQELADHKLTCRSPEMRSVIERCLSIKKQIVEQDEEERGGLRAILNFGHTVGHALEKCVGYGEILHGEAISIGMVYEAILGEQLQYTVPGTSELIRRHLTEQGLPTALPDVSVDWLTQAMASDKKRTAQGLAFSLLDCIGKCKLRQDIPESAVKNALKP